MIRWLALGALLLFAGGGQHAYAAFCTAFASTLSFGNYNGSTTVSVTGSVTVTCSVGNVFHVGLNAGLGSGGTTTTRIMNNGANLLSYKLFQDAAHTINWGNNPPTDTINGTGNGNPQAFTIYGTIPAGQIVSVNSYSDTIVANITSSAALATATFGVNATVQAGCTVSATGLNFGNYSGALIDAASALTVTCTNLTTFNIGLSAGTATGATVTTRRMTSPALATLNYVLFRDVGRTANWGNTVGTDTLLSQGSGAPVQYGVFGRMAAGQSRNPAVYTDTIIATVSF